MSAWRGLFNPEKHYNEPQWDVVPGDVYCWGCESEREYPWCSRKHPCRCCLVAEVERLTAELAESERLLKWWVIQGMAFAQLINKLRGES